MPIISKWIKSESILHNDIDIYNSVKHHISLKPRIDMLIDRINVQIARFNEISQSLKKQDDEAFKKITASVKGNNGEYPITFLSDLNEIRKVYKVTTLSIIVFEKLEAKLKNIANFSDLVIILGPAVAILKSLRSCLARNISEYKDDVAVISELVGAILVDAGQVGGYTINFETANNESVHFLDEISLIVEQRIKEEFRDLPDL